MAVLLMNADAPTRTGHAQRRGGQLDNRCRAGVRLAVITVSCERTISWPRPNLANILGYCDPAILRASMAPLPVRQSVATKQAMCRRNPFERGAGILSGRVFGRSSQETRLHPLSSAAARVLRFCVAGRGGGMK